MKRLIILFFILYGSIGQMVSKTYLVSIGVSDYPGTQNDMKMSDKDAITMKNLYEKNCHADAILLINDSAKLTTVTKQMKSLFSKASGDDTIILFFSGHGIPGAFVCYDQILYYSTINKIMSSSPAKNKIVFSDSCYSGKARKSNKHTNVSQDTNVMFFLSSRTDEVSRENGGWNNGYFTAYLERGLRGGADSNRDRKITALELFQFVSERVKKVTRDKQHPVMWGNFDNEMPVMIWK